MTNKERQLAISIALKHIADARKELSIARVNFKAICKDIGLEHSSLKTIDIALEKTKIAEAQIFQLNDKIKAL